MKIPSNLGIFVLKKKNTKMLSICSAKPFSQRLFSWLKKIDYGL
jgi:hypothetical protein